MNTPQKSLGEFLCRVESMTGLDSLDTIALAERTRELLHDLGQEDFSVFTLRAASDQPDRQLFLGTMKENWSARYAHQGYSRVDPILAPLATADEPYAWTDVPMANQSRAALQVMDEARSIGYVNGIVVPLHIKGVGAAGFATFAKHNEVPPGTKTALQVLAHKVSRRVALLNRMNVTTLQPLTKREIEVLRWTALGHDTAGAAHMMSISKKTVEFHIRKAQDKLNTVNRINSVVVAMAAGMLAF